MSASLLLPRDFCGLARSQFDGRSALSFDDFKPKVGLLIRQGLALQFLDQHERCRPPYFTPRRLDRSYARKHRLCDFLVVKSHNCQIVRNPDCATLAFKESACGK